MSQKPEVVDRIRSLARQHPGWTPSQIAIYLQGERLKVTSEDVRRVLARPTEEGVTTPPRYAAPREQPHRSAWPTGILFGVILFAISLGLLYAGESIGNALTGYIFIAVSVLLLILAGAITSRRWASGALAGLIAADVYSVLYMGLALVGWPASSQAQRQSMLGSLPKFSTHQAVMTMLVGIAVTLVVAGAFGLILGWIGALLFGRRKRRATLGGV